jgi:hypothetical protein
MRRTITFSIFLLSTAIYCALAVADTIDIRLRINDIGRRKEKVINRENLIRIKQFILQNGQRETYCNMYNNNPAYGTKGFKFYLDPDTGQKNINCELEKSDFNHLTIRSSAGGKNQYRTVEFIDQNVIYVTADWPSDDLTVSQIRSFVEDAIQEFLSELDQKKPNKPADTTR